MPVEIDLGNAPAGYALSSAEAGTQVCIQTREFCSTEDGSHFVQRLEGLPNEIIAKMSNPVLPSRVDHLLAICRRDGKATVWINELKIAAFIRAGRAVRAGEEVYRDHIVDLERVELGVHVPADSGVLLVFSVGWRKGLFYDFRPIAGPDPPPREYDIGDFFGQLFAYLMFQERFSIGDEEWRELFAAKWFPFAGLSHTTIASILHLVRSGDQADRNLKNIVNEVKKKAARMLESWSRHSAFAGHMTLLRRAVDRFESGDAVSCTALVYPRIEGLLRSHQIQLGVQDGFRQERLVQAAVASKIRNTASALLPRRFADYLREVYFRDFSPTDRCPDVSRHTVGHGIADVARFDDKSAAIGLLILHQLFYLLEDRKPTHGREERKDEGK